MKMVKNCKNCRCASHYLFSAHERLNIQLGHHEETEEYEVYEELLDESVVETVNYEALVYDEMSVFPISLVLLLYPSCPDVAQYELSSVENLIPDVALDELPAVEDLSASVDTTGNACLSILSDLLSGRDTSFSQPRQSLPGENIFTAYST